MTDMSDIRIREARPDEAEAVAALIRRAFEQQCRIYEDWTLPPMRESEESVLESMRTGVVLVAEESGHIVGTVQGNRTETSSVYVGRLAVDPKVQSRGIGRALTVAIENHFPDATEFELFTGHLSQTALSLYESLGYTRVDEVPERDGLTLVYLTKRVSPE